MPKSLTEILRPVEPLLRMVHAAPQAASARPFGDETTVFFMQGGKGLALTGEDANAYRRTLLDLLEQFADKGERGQKAVASAFQRAIIAVALGTHLDRDITRAMDALRKDLSVAPSSWTVLLPVRGLDPKQLPRRLGSVRFLRLTQRRESAIRHRSGGSKKVRRQVVPKDLPDRVFAEIQVLAADEEAAQVAAMRRLRQALDILNFYAEFLSYSNPLVYVPGDRDATHTIAFTYKSAETTGVWISNSREGPVGLLDLRDLIGRANKCGVARIDRALRKPEPNSLEHRLIQAVTAAGRGVAAARSDAALLHAVTALETAILGLKKGGEIGFRFRLRCAKLLGKTVASRQALVKRLDVIYDLRSRATHAGATEIRERDLAMARAMARNAIVRLLTHRSLSRLTDDEALEAWFNRLVIR